MDKKETPWPIEMDSHPFGTRKKEKKDAVRHYNPDESKSLSRDLGENPEKVAAKCFENPRLYRDLILEHVAVPPRESFEGGSVFYLWMNKVCPVGCGFCFFKSPTISENREEAEITDEGIDRMIQFSKDAKLDKFVVSGGGEPLMSARKVNALIRGVHAETLVVVTSGYWSGNTERTDKTLSELCASSEANPHVSKVVIRLSLDKDHFGRLSRGHGFQYVQHIIDWFSEHTNVDSKFQFLIHTMEGDKTVDAFLSSLDIDERSEQTKYLNRKTGVRLKNNFFFGVEYSQIFDSNPDVDLRDDARRAEHEKTFRDFIEQRRNGNMSLSFHGDNKPKGAYFLTFYDGTVIVWGSTSPDVEASIYQDDYRSVMDKNLKDIITLASLEKGPYFIHRIVAEVDPRAVERAIGVGLRDFYARLLLEEDSVRLYLSVRLIQEYIADGKIHHDSIAQWPTQLRDLVGLNKEQLKEIYLHSSYNIVQQYLQDREVSAKKLLHLYRRVRLGHYSVTPEKMCEQVATSRIDQSIKESFNLGVVHI